MRYSTYRRIIFSLLFLIGSAYLLPAMAQPVLSYSITNTEAGLSQGSINLTASGSGPFTYAWSNGGITDTLSSLSIGHYSVTVTDNNSLTTTTTISVGVDVTWIDLSYSTATETTLQSITSNNINRAGASGQEVLKANTTGWIEYSLKEATIRVMGFIGLEGGNPLEPFGYKFYALYQGSKLYPYYEGVYLGAQYAVSVDDVIRLERDGSTGAFKVYQNGTLLYTTTQTDLGQLRAGAQVHQGNSKFEDVRSSFSDQLPTVTEVITDLTSLSGNTGAIDITPSGSSSFTYAWSNAATTEDVSSLTAGTYTVTITANSGVSITRNYGIGVGVVWQGLVDATATGSSLQRNGGGHSSKSGGYTKQILPANTTGWVEFSASELSYRALHFKQSNPTNVLTDVSEFSVWTYHLGSIWTYERNSSVSPDFNYNTEDLIRIERDGSSGQFRFYKNGHLFYESTHAYTGELVFVAQFISSNEILENVHLSFEETLPEVSETVTNLSGGFSDNGAIDLTESASYTYAWSSGETTRNLNGLTAGNYTVTITASNGLSVERSYSVGYPAGWTALSSHTSVSNGDLVKTSGASGSYVFTGKSAELLPANTDGWLEFSIGDRYTSKAVGFLDANTNATELANYPFAFFYSSDGRMYLYERNSIVKELTTKTGDVLRIQRNGTTGLATYYVNGHLVYTSSQAETGDLNMSSILIGPNSEVNDARLSFKDIPPAVDWTLTNLSGQGLSDGSINLTATGNAPFTYSWSNGSTNKDQSNLALGAYTVTVTDNAGLTKELRLHVGYDVLWENLVNTTQTGADLSKSSSNNSFNATAESAPILAANTTGWMEFRRGADGNKIIGFIDLSQGSPISYSNYTFELYFTTGNLAYIYQGSAHLKTISSTSSDVFRIERDGTTGLAHFYQNGQLVCSSTQSQKEALSLGAVLGTSYSSFEDVHSSFTAVPPHIAVEVTNLTNHETPDGQINLTVSGTGPYTYAWDHGADTEDLSGLEAGSYIVSVTDATGAVTTTEIGVGFLVDWTTMASATFSNGLLSSTSGSPGWNAGAISTSVALANKPTWMEYTIQGTSDTRILAFQDANYNSSPTDITDFIFGVYLYESGLGYVMEYDPSTTAVVVAQSFTYQDGDLIRLSRDSDGYFQCNLNRQVVYDGSLASGPYNNTAALIGEAIFYTPYAEFDEVRYSDVFPLEVVATVNPVTFGEDGSVDLNISGGTAPYQIAWNGEDLLSAAAFDSVLIDLDTLTWDSTLSAFDFTTLNYADYLDAMSANNQLADLEPGLYTYTVTDANQATSSGSVRVGELPIYESTLGVDFTATSVSSTAANGWGNAYALDAKNLELGSNGWLSFTVPSTDSEFAVGWLPEGATPSHLNLLYGFYVDNGTMRIIENGSFQTETTSIQAGDQFTLERDGTSVNYLKNETTTIRTLNDHSTSSLRKFVGLEETAVSVDGLQKGYDVPLNSPIGIGVAVGDASCGFPKAGSLTIPNGYANNPNYQYIWSNGSTSATLQGLTPGMYTVTLTNVNSSSFQLVRSYEVANKVYWEEHQNTESGPVETNTILNPLGSAGAGEANSRNSSEYYPNIIPGGETPNEYSYWVEFEVPDLAINGGGYKPFTATIGLRDEGSTNWGVGPYLLMKSVNNSNTINCILIDNNAQMSSYFVLQDATAGDRLRFEYNAVSNGLDCKTQLGNASATVIVYKYGTQIAQLGPVTFTTCQDIRARINTPNTELLRVRTNLLCDEINQYAKLLRKPDGGYYTIIDGRVHFKYIEEYQDSDNLLNYKVYDDLHNDVTSNTGNISPSSINFGDNRLSLDVSNLSTGYYLLEVQNEKKETTYLRFKI